ncbi:MAG: twin-arginine translocation signal domain-containing protein [Verrucomicrobia bacterium]|nr:twin-arginine translocation signal domain-containing protein [Verrucomicrobiota bacterium]
MLTRRDFLKAAAASAVALPSARPPAVCAQAASTARVPRAVTGLGLCPRYEYAAVRRVLGRMFDELGDVRSLVKGKHVTVKVNLVNTSAEDVAGVPLWLTVTVHPVVAQALGGLLVEYGARAVVFLRSVAVCLA